MNTSIFRTLRAKVTAPSFLGRAGGESLLLLLLFASCNSWLEEATPGTTKIGDYFEAGSETAAENVVNSAYAPLQWDFGDTYCAEWFIGDIASDDALKGGQSVADGQEYYDIDNFKVQADNRMLLDYYRAQWTGIARANLAINELPVMSGDSISPKLRSRLIAEARFLRAYYYFRLVRVFGGMPIIDFVVDSSNKWHQQRASLDKNYEFILADLTAAEAGLWLKSEYDEADAGRATKGAAQAMLAKVYLNQKNYGQAKTWAQKVITSGEYDLFRSVDGGYFQNFTLDGENGLESVFEIQYMDDDMSDYGGFGYTRGSFTQILTRSRSAQLGGGWGFNHPTQNLYDEYETAPTLDPRRDLTILNPTDAQMTNPEEETYLGNRYMSNKLAWRNLNGTFPKISHDSRGPLNNRQIRYADVLLMYAEACCELGGAENLTAAKNALNEVRGRVGLAAFPYTATYSGTEHTFADTQADLRTAIRHERRVELAMEGHRWFDLVRWGIAKQTLDAYIAAESSEARSHWGFFQEGKNELFPIPTKELELSGISQNPGY